MVAFYKNKRKDPWRGWAWNQIASRLGVPVDESLVLYLCGPEPLDFIKARQKGFRKHNLVGISSDASHVRAMRKHKLFAIHADLEVLLTAWPSDWRFSGLLADFCCDINPGFLYTLCGCVPEGTPVVLNYQRGRRRLHHVERKLRNQYIGEYGLHRGYHAFAQYCVMVAWESGYFPRWYRKHELTSHPAFPAFNSYCSSNSRSNVKFDSVAFTAPNPPLRFDFSEINSTPQANAIRKARRDISAFRAINRDLAIARGLRNAG